MLKRIIKEEIFLLEDTEKIGEQTLFKGVYKRLLFENGTISWCCIDSTNVVYTHNPPNVYWITIHELLENYITNELLRKTEILKLMRYLHRNKNYKKFCNFKKMSYICTI